MELRVLNYFLEVAREGSITGAAKVLHISQPTLSKQLKDLEYELGSKLFVRSNYSVKLTDEGILLRKRAEDILEMANKTLEEFSNLNDITGGDVRIGCAGSDIPDCVSISKAGTPDRLRKIWNVDYRILLSLWNRLIFPNTIISPCPKRTSGAF